MRDIGKLREDEPQLGQEAEHLAGDRLNVVLAADNDEGRTSLILRFLFQPWRYRIPNLFGLRSRAQR